MTRGDEEVSVQYLPTSDYQETLSSKDKMQQHKDRPIGSIIRNDHLRLLAFLRLH